MGSGPPWTDFYENWQGWRGPWRNHSVQFWFQYFQGFQIYRGSKFPSSHWLCWSSLQQCCRYHAACDKYKVKVVLTLKGHIHRLNWLFELVSVYDIFLVLILCIWVNVYLVNITSFLIDLFYLFSVSWHGCFVLRTGKFWAQAPSIIKAALIKSLPKPDSLKTVTATTTARGALLQLADYALWQFFCGSDGSGSSKLNMSNKMPVIYKNVIQNNVIHICNTYIICTMNVIHIRYVVVQKIMNVTEKEAATALLTCLKNTKNRSSARKYLEKLRCANSVQEDAMEDTTESAHEDNSVYRRRQSARSRRVL